ncbi:MAG TPA: class 1 fructose-bisphosphatase [Firmicutes bacterium]|jgi:fructose-1,6-bisphosphatase I|nr:class 1 fructose-bisphosphatase [Bacillota bacterium]
MDTLTVSQHIIEQQKQFPEATGEYTGLLENIILAAKIITREVRKAGLVEILGLTGKKNVQGEDVQKLDIFANDTMVKILGRGGHVCIMASEEVEDPIYPVDGYPIGKYVVSFDPLDGSSNIDVNASIGTIFGVHRRKSEGGRGTIDDLLQKGTELVGAGYVIYGSSTIMVYSAGFGVHGFTYDPSVGEFLLSHEDIRIPSKGSIYSINEGNTIYWDEPIRKYVEYLKSKHNHVKKPYTARYIGSLVADFHRNLLRGGIFLYPRDNKDPKKPHGKLRLLYEAQPLAYIVEQAGGAASTGTERILDIQPTELHQRVPLIIGSKEDVEMVEEFIAGKY